MIKKNVIIIGAGPGGMQLAYYLEKNNFDYLVLDKNDKAGGQFEKLPIRRKLISINKVYTGCEDPEVNLRFDWNSLLSDGDDKKFKDYSKEYFPAADDLVTYLNDFADHHSIKVNFNIEVQEINKPNHFEITTNNGSYVCDYLVVATGFTKPYLPKIKNIELCKNYVDNINPSDYANKRVLILGKGNSAFETADELIPYASLIHCLSPNTVEFAWQSHYVGNLRALNNNLLDTYQLKSQNALIDGELVEINKEGEGFVVTVSYKNAPDEVEELHYDEVIACTGFRFDATIFNERIRPNLSFKDKYPLQNSSWESENLENLFFAGTITHLRDYRKSTSGFIHGFRYNSKCLFHILNSKINNRVWHSEPAREIKAINVANEIIENVNRSSSIWLQFGFIAHVIALDYSNGNYTYYYDVPVDYLKDHPEKFGSEDYLIITLEYGDEIIKKAPNIFALERVHKDDIANAHLSPSLHPIVRAYSSGEIVSEYHVIEDFESKWNEPDVHVAPLIKYLERHISTQGEKSPGKEPELA